MGRNVLKACTVPEMDEPFISSGHSAPCVLRPSESPETPNPFTVQVGSAGPEAETAVRALIELGRRQKIGKRLGAQAVIKAECR